MDSNTVLSSVVALTFLPDRKPGVTEGNWCSIFKTLSCYIISQLCRVCAVTQGPTFCFSKPCQTFNQSHQL